MKIDWRLIVLGILIGVTASFAQSEAAEEPVVVIDDEPMTLEEFWEKVDQLPMQYQSMMEENESRRSFLDQLIQERTLYLAALEEDYPEDEEIRQALEDARIRTLASYYYQRNVGSFHGYSEEELREYYEENPDYFLTEAQVRMRHILLENEAQAREARRVLVEGEASFADLAKDISIDAKTRRLGGMIGLVSERATLPQLGRVPELQEVIFDMPVGEVSEPIQSDMGWHLVLIEEKIPAQLMEFERVKQKVADYMLVDEERAREYYEEHRDEYMTEPQVDARLVFCIEEDDIDAAYAALESGMDPAAVVEEYSDDEKTKADEGRLGFVKETTPVSILGRDSREVLRTAFTELEDGEYSEPIQTTEGWAVIIREGHREPRIKSYEEVVSTVRGAAVNEARQELQQNFFDELLERYDVTVYEETLFSERPPQESAAELYDKAEVAPPPTAINLYRDILEYYPESDEAPKAQFMIGFLYSDKLKNYDEAEEAFRAYLENWPDGEFADDAEYMLEHMRDEEIDISASEDADDEESE
jgi:peptidyl-prolyl cis-trans isomerase C